MTIEKPIHIGVVCDPASFHTQKWAQGLLVAGAKVTVFSYSPQKIEGVECVQLPFSWASKRGEPTYFSYLWGGGVLTQALNTHKVDVVNPINVTPFGVWAAAANFSPMLMVSMGADILEYPPKDVVLPVLDSRAWNNVSGGKMQWLARLKQGISKPIFRYFVKRALQKSQLITGDNWVLVNAIRDWFGIDSSKLQLNRWGVEPELFAASEDELTQLRRKFGIDPTRKLVLSPRGVKAIYQGDIILDGFERCLQAGNEDAHFLMLAAGYEVPPTLQAKADELAQRYNNFSFWNTVLPRTDLYQLWNLVDVFVSAPIYDGYSNALGEGRFVGAIPVTNDIPATREILRHKDNACIVAPFDAPNLASALNQILANLPEWKSLVQEQNRHWMQQNSLLAVNMQKIVAEAQRLRESR